MLFDYLFLPVLFALLLYFSWRDFRSGKISNRWLLVGFAWGGAVLLALFLWTLVARPVSLFVYERFWHIAGNQARPVFTVSLVYLGQTLGNFATAVLVAFIFWRLRVWKAGDAKLFCLVALLLPLKYYARSYFFLFPSLPLLVNIFCVAIAWLLLKKIFNFFRKAPPGGRRQKLTLFIRKLWVGQKSKLKSRPLSFLLVLNIQLVAVLFFPVYRNAILLGSLALMLLFWRFLLPKGQVFWGMYLIFTLLALALAFWWIKIYPVGQLFGLAGQLALYMAILVFFFTLLNASLGGKRLTEAAASRSADERGRKHFALMIFLGTLLTMFLSSSVLSFLN